MENESIQNGHSPMGRLLAPIEGKLTSEFAQVLVDLKADPALQARLEVLASKSTEGELTNEELAEYQGLVHGINFMSALQAKARKFMAGEHTAA